MLRDRNILLAKTINDTCILTVAITFTTASLRTVRSECSFFATPRASAVATTRETGTDSVIGGRRWSLIDSRIVKLDGCAAKIKVEGVFVRIASASCVDASERRRRAMCAEVTFIKANWYGT